MTTSRQAERDARAVARRWLERTLEWEMLDTVMNSYSASADDGGDKVIDVGDLLDDEAGDYPPLVKSELFERYASRELGALHEHLVRGEIDVFACEACGGEHRSWLPCEELPAAAARPRLLEILRAAVNRLVARRRRVEELEAENEALRTDLAFARSEAARLAGTSAVERSA